LGHSLSPPRGPRRLPARRAAGRRQERHEQHHGSSPEDLLMGLIRIAISSRACWHGWVVIRGTVVGQKCVKTGRKTGAETLFGI
jgi:hypothetical protein